MYLAMRIVYDAAEAPFPRLMPDEVARLPRQTVEGLKAAGILRHAEMAKAVSCVACEADHVEWVNPAVDDSGQLRYFIDCPEKGTVEVSRERIQRWMVDFTPIANAISRGFGAGGQVEAIRPGRIWRLGAARLAGRIRDLWMVRDAYSVRGPEIVAAVPKTLNAVLFRLGMQPVDRSLFVGFDGVFDIRAVVDLTETGLQVRRDLVEQRLGRWTHAARLVRKGSAAAHGVPESARLFAAV